MIHILLSAIAVVSAAPEAAEPLSATVILERMASAYAGALTYTDSGSVRTTFIDHGGSRRVTERRFKTSFVRPDRFRLEFAERGCCEDERPYIVWMDGAAVRTWWEIRPEVEEVASLGEALGGAAGVSQGVSMRVPALLVPDALGAAAEAGARLQEYEGATRLSDEHLDGAVCFRLQARVYDEPTVIWIDQATYLLRRLDALGREYPGFTNSRGEAQPGFRTEETTVYTPAINLLVSEESLEFKAPKAGGLTMQ